MSAESFKFPDGALASRAAKPADSAAPADVAALRSEVLFCKTQLLRLSRELAMLRLEMEKARSAPPPDAANVRPEAEAQRPADKHAAYLKVIAATRQTVEASTEQGAVVLVVSRGDEQLLQFTGRRGWHFPQTDSGVYAGHNPRDSAAAIAHVEALRAKGARYIVFPATAFWWLDHYRELRAHLHNRCKLVFRQENICAIYQLSGDAMPVSVAQPAAASEYDDLVRRVRELACAILPDKCIVAVISRGDEQLIKLGSRQTRHFPSSESGAFAGTYPATGEQAVAMLEEARAGGADYLLIPQTAMWWLTHYRELREHLEERYFAVVRQQHVCCIYDLKAGQHE